jgi:hypothetical protein
VVRKEDGRNKTRYYLRDGSIYVIRKGRGSYRYLYDSQTRTVTYEFKNGQVERTFDGGIKEIRRKTGEIVIKCGINDYEYAVV